MARAAGGPIRRARRQKTIVLLCPTGTPLPTCSITRDIGLATCAAPATLALPVTLDTPSAPIEVAHGLSATIPIKVTRTKGADGALTISPLPLPPGLTIANATIAAKAAEGKLTVATAIAAPLGTMTIGLQAKGKVAGPELTFSLPAVTLFVVPPATVALATAAVEVGRGTTLKVKKAKSSERTVGSESPVTIKINGLPAGLKAEPVTLAGAVSDFAVKIVADAKAAPASAGTQVAIAYQIEMKDYSVPPAALTVKVLPSK